MVVQMSMLMGMYSLVALVSLLSALLASSHLFTAFATGAMFVLLTVSIPVHLAWSRNNFGFLVWWFVGSIIFAILIYAIVYWRTGLVVAAAHQQVSFSEAVYFSVTTWVTLGYGDYAAARPEQLVTSAEALTGYFGMAIFVALVVLWLTEALGRYDSYVEQLPQLARKAAEELSSTDPRLAQQLKNILDEADTPAGGTDSRPELT